MNTATETGINSGIPTQSLQFLESLQQSVSKETTINGGFYGEERSLESLRALTDEEFQKILEIAKDCRLPVVISSAQFGFSCALSIHTANQPASRLFYMTASQLPDAVQIRGDDNYDTYQPRLTQKILDIVNTPENLTAIERAGLNGPEKLSYYIY